MKLEDLLLTAFTNKASDVHISAGQPPIIRVDGDIIRLKMPVLSDEDVHGLISPIMEADRLERWNKRTEDDFSYELPGVSRFRVNTYRQHLGRCASFRVINLEVLDFETLGMGELLKRLALLPRGLVLITGPTGCGKSATLAAMVDYINTNRPKHILTLEDPIEHLHVSKMSLVTQREIHRDTLSFASALRAGLREDPDVIMLGELRDLDTIRLALTAAETGHFVIGTLHTASGPKTVDRMIDVFPDGEKALARTMLAESLQAVITQTLVKRIGGGRVAAREVLLATPAVKNLIREDQVNQISSAIQTSMAVGMITMDASLKKLVSSGTVSLEEARSHAHQPDGF